MIFSLSSCGHCCEDGRDGEEMVPVTTVMMMTMTTIMIILDNDLFDDNEANKVPDKEY